MTVNGNSTQHSTVIVEEKKSVSDLIDETGKVVGGKIEVAQFVRFQLGEALGDDDEA